MKSLKLIASVCIAFVVVGAFIAANAQSWKKGDVAPAFSATGSDGRTHTLRSLTANRPLVLYFIGSTCPINDQAVKYYNRVAEAYRGRVNFIGVIDADKAGYERWQATHKAPFPVLFDKDMKIIRAYRAQRSPWTIAIGRDRKIIQEWVGYSVGEINELSASIAGAAKVAVRRVDTSGAPTEPRAG